MLNKVEDSYGTSIIDEDGKLMDVFLSDDEQWHIKVEDDIPENLKIAVLTYEDKNFYKHNGVDLLAIFRALKNNILGKKRSGASTITMQAVKLAYPKKRTYINKFIEIIDALKLETKVNKDDILKLYLNNAPYGGNIVGYGTAARMYFKKDPTNLSYAECALLAVLPNSPSSMNVEKNRDKLISKRNNLLDKLYKLGRINENQLYLSKKEPIPSVRYNFERIVPHLARRLKNENKSKVIYTNINSILQNKMEKIVKEYIAFTKLEGIKNASLILIENKTRDVKAYIGSQDFMDMDNGGQVDGVIAKRSPGSITKPFLYALSIDEGLIAPESLIQDVPMYFANFNPQNANKKYTGLIEAKNALISSLNIPFVHLLSLYGSNKLYYFFKDMLNFEENEPDNYGLSLILGTKEFTLEDIASLYTGLANYGVYNKLNYKKNIISTYSNITNTINRDKHMFSKGASFLTLQTLKEVVRPGINNLYSLKNPISWKTGTSFGKKDAWACGMTPEYTLAVWVGNFTGESNDNLSGAMSAGRLLFNAFDEIYGESYTSEFEEPYDDLYNLKVDDITGYRIEDIDKFNIKTKIIKYPKSAKALRLSPYYKKIYVDENGVEVDSRDESFINSHSELVLNYPLEVINYYIRENIDLSEIYNKNVNDKTIKILYPTPNLKVLIPKDLDKNQKLIIKIANIKNKELYWYLDKEFIYKDKVLEKEVELIVGEHNLTIVAEDGETTSVKFYVTK